MVQKNFNFMWCLCDLSKYDFHFNTSPNWCFNNTFTLYNLETLPSQHDSLTWHTWRNGWRRWKFFFFQNFHSLGKIALIGGILCYFNTKRKRVFRTKKKCFFLYAYSNFSFLPTMKVYKTWKWEKLMPCWPDLRSLCCYTF